MVKSEPIDSEHHVNNVEESLLDVNSIKHEVESEPIEEEFNHNDIEQPFVQVQEVRQFYFIFFRF